MGARAQLVVDVTAQCMKIGNAALVADSCGALYWPARSTLLVADLHLEKGAHFAGRGSFLPPYDTPETLRRLADAIARYRPRHVIALGDSFHSPEAARTIAARDVAALHAMQDGRDWTWVTGNHDPAIGAHLGGHIVDEMTIDGITLRHEPSGRRDRAEIAGHLHPMAQLVRDGVALRRRCFVTDGERAVLPAFGAYTGGLNVLDRAFAAALSEDAPLLVLMLGGAGLYPVPVTLLRPDHPYRK